MLDVSVEFSLAMIGYSKTHDCRDPTYKVLFTAGGIFEVAKTHIPSILQNFVIAADETWKAALQIAYCYARKKRVR